MKQSNKGFDYSYNAQAVVDGAEQIIVAAEVTNAGQRQTAGGADGASGAGELGGGRNRAAEGSRRHARRRFRTRPTPATSAKKRSRMWRQMGLDPYFATGRQKHHEVGGSACGGSPRLR